ncbi:MAG: CHAT domain-containing protein [Pseudomonadota bacterium]
MRRIAALCAVLSGFCCEGHLSAQTADGTLAEQLKGNVEAAKLDGDWQRAAGLVVDVFMSERVGDLADDDALALYNTGVDLLAALDDADRSRILDEAALAEFSRRSNQTGVLTARLSLASVAFWERQLDDALVMIEALIDETRNRPQFADQYLGALVLRAHAYRFDKDNDACIELLTPIASEQRDEVYASATSNTWFLVNRVLSLCHRNQGVANDWDMDSLEKAAAFAEAAATHIEQDADSQPLDRAIALDTRARTYWEMGRKEEAIAFEHKAVTELETHGLDVGRDYAQQAAILSVYLARNDDAETALVYGERAVAAARAHYLRAFFGPRAATYDDRYYLLYATNAYFASLAGVAEKGIEIPDSRLDAAFQYAQYTATSDIGDALKRVAADASARSRDVRRYLGAQDRLRDEWRRLSREVSLLATESERYAAALAQKQEERASVSAELARLQDDVSADVRTYLGLWDTDAVSLATMQQSLDDDEMYFIITGIFSYVTVIAVTSTDVHWHRPAFERDEFCNLARAQRRSLSVMTDLDCANEMVGMQATFQPLAPFDVELAHDLYERLFGPAVRELGDKPNWIISATGLASTVAFPALLTDTVPVDEGAAPQFASLPWLGSQKTLFLAPKASAFTAARSSRSGRKASTSDLRVVVAGSPCIGEFAGDACASMADASVTADNETLSAMVTRRGAVDRDYTNLPALPGAFAELRRISQRIDDVTELTGPAFTRPRMLDALSSPGDVLVLSTHALAASESGLDQAALVLSPVATDESRSMLLTAGDVAQLELPYDWVVLSGCHTGSPAGDPRAEVFTGLALAFLQAGSQAVLVSTFEVLDGSSAEFVPDVLEAYAGGTRVRKAEAIRTAVAGLLSDPDSLALHHPTHWAAYAVVGAAPR